MLSEIVTFFLAIVGILFILFSFVFRILLWKEDGIKIFLPLTENSSCERDIERGFNIIAILQFLGIHKKCTVVFVNCGASEEYCNKVSEFFGNVEYVKIINSEDIMKELRT